MLVRAYLAFMVFFLSITVEAVDREGSELANPVLLQSGGELIDVAVGHAAPYVIDFDGDGKRDLLVGEFGVGSFPSERLPNDPKLRSQDFSLGKLRVYRNLGTDSDPRYDGYEYLVAGAEHASIPTT